jgi:hypothetical protein
MSYNIRILHILCRTPHSVKLKHPKFLNHNIRDYVTKQCLLRIYVIVCHNIIFILNKYFKKYFPTMVCVLWRCLCLVDLVFYSYVYSNQCQVTLSSFVSVTQLALISLDLLGIKRDIFMHCYPTIEKYTYNLLLH